MLSSLYSMWPFNPKLNHTISFLHSQEIARAAGQGIADGINLDVHAIAELKERGFPPTSDAPKYNYESKDGIYC